MEVLIDLGVFALLIASGYFWGTYLEQSHYKSIRKREKQFSNIHATNLKEIGLEFTDSALVYGSVVITHDYFKKLLAHLKNIFGGRVTVYESLLDRARREAKLRMKEMAIRNGFNTIINMRIETSSITKNAQESVGAVEILAYGTGVKLENTRQA